MVVLSSAGGKTNIENKHLKVRATSHVAKSANGLLSAPSKCCRFYENFSDIATTVKETTKWFTASPSAAILPVVKV